MSPLYCLISSSVSGIPNSDLRETANLGWRALFCSQDLTHSVLSRITNRNRAWNEAGGACSRFSVPSGPLGEVGLRAAGGAGNQSLALTVISMLLRTVSPPGFCAAKVRTYFPACPGAGRQFNSPFAMPLRLAV